MLKINAFAFDNVFAFNNADDAFAFDNEFAFENFVSFGIPHHLLVLLFLCIVSNKMDYNYYRFSVHNSECQL